MKFLYFLLLISLKILVPDIKAQDTLMPIHHNGYLIEYYKNHKKKHLPSVIESSITLPFFDDFSQIKPYPNPHLWEDSAVFINNNYPILPVSYGVATFDGLNKNGYPYDFINPNNSGIADYLTSKNIDLKNPSGDVFLSFFYQAKGHGNLPEKNDSLILEFLNEKNQWIRVWGATAGNQLFDFKRVMLKISNNFFYDEFKFRFKNIATLSGNNDHWHLDYIYLNDNRSIIDTSIVDVSIITNHYPFLKNYSQMPWKHYIIDSINNMATTLPTLYKNNDNKNTYAIFFKYQIITNNGHGKILITYPLSAASRNIPKSDTIIEHHAIYNPPINNFYFKPDTSKSKVFMIKNFFRLNVPDSVKKNDTIISYQVFGNEYAYDDGSAEMGYGVFGRNASLAQKFYIAKKDTLTAIKINFNPILKNHSDKTFTLKVWKNLNPTQLVYQETLSYSPKYLYFNQFNKYKLSKSIVLEPDTYYFGYSKTTQDFLNVGFDVNTNHNKDIFYSTGNTFFQANFKGSLLLRPVFSSNLDPLVSVKELSKMYQAFSIYPNPVRNILKVKRNNPDKQIIILKIYSSIGQLIRKKITYNSYFEVPMHSLNPGIYFLSLQTNTGIIQNQKIIVVEN